MLLKKMIIKNVFQLKIFNKIIQTFYSHTFNMKKIKVKQQEAKPIFYQYFKILSSQLLSEILLKTVKSLIPIQQKMIRNVTNLFCKLRLPAFSTYRGNQPFRSHTQDQKTSSKAYLKQDAEKVFQQVFKQNPIRQEQKVALESEMSTEKPTSSYEYSFDPYRVLGLGTGASKQQIDQAYRQLALKHHSRADSSAQSGEKFVQISKAYEMLRPMKKEGKMKSSTGNSYVNQISRTVKDFTGLSSGIGSSKKNKNKQGDLNKNRSENREFQAEEASENMKDNKFNRQ